MSKICSIEGCGKKVHGYGLCNSHYRKKLAEHKKRMKEVCVIKGCDCPVVARGLCRKHYIRWYKYGRTTRIKGRSGYAKKHADEHNIWQGMCARCYNHKKTEYNYYGGRGIRVCDRWLGPDGFEHFYEDMGPRPEGKFPSGKPFYSIDRIDVNGDYAPENCRWATAKEQSDNQRRTQQ